MHLQPARLTGERSSSVRPVCFPHCSPRALRSAGKRGLAVTLKNRDYVCTRLNKMAIQTWKYDLGRTAWNLIRRIISTLFALRSSVFRNVLKTRKYGRPVTPAPAAAASSGPRTAATELGLYRLNAACKHVRFGGEGEP